MVLSLFKNSSDTQTYKQPQIFIYILTQKEKKILLIQFQVLW